MTSLTPLAQRILEERYLLRNAQGRIIETPREMFIRVAHTIALQENTPAGQAKWYETFLKGLLNLEWCPASPCLMNAGTELQQLSACFILDIEDTMDSIFSTLKEAALIYKTGGGVGFNFGWLREKGAIIGTTKGYSSGTTAWLKVYDTAIEAISQGGKRRGAALGLLPVHHPDIEDWLKAKAKDQEMANFNLSVAITAEFMTALEKDASFRLVSPLGYTVKEVPARELWNKICYQAWASGEPGLFFIDRVNQDNPNPQLGKINAGNPCSEFLAVPNSSCNLASINLEKHLVYQDNKWAFNWHKFRETISTVTRFLDNMIDANHLPLPQLREMAWNTRPIGLGFMGLARVLKALDLGYNTVEGRIWASKMAEFLRLETEKASQYLAKDRGCYPAWIGSLWEQKQTPIRNSHLLSIAPTGTIATLVNTSWSLEPDFAPLYQRRILEGKVFSEMDPQLESVLHNLGFDPQEYKPILEEQGSIQGIKDLPPEVKKTYVYALDITAQDHLKMQAAVQKHVDGAISKTINLPAQAQVKDVEEAFYLAYQLGLKGCTVYRQGTRLNQVLTLTANKDEKKACLSGSCPTCPS